MQTYVNSTREAINAVEKIVSLVKSGRAEPLIGLDIETSPRRELVGYPNTLFDEAGDRIEPSKKLYLEYVQQTWGRNLDIKALAAAGVFLPRKLTSGNEFKGVPAREAWENLLAEVEKRGTTWLSRFYWTVNRLDTQTAEVVSGLAAAKAALAAAQTELEARPKGRIMELRRRVKELVALVAELELELARLDSVDFENQIDARLLLHILRVAVNNWVKTDPIKPGLDPYTSEIFLVQFTLRLDDGELESFIFNMRNVEAELLLPALRLSREATYIGANIKFDLAHLLRAVGEAPTNVWCTRVASRMLNLGLKMSHSLAAVADRFCELELAKEARNTFVGVWRDEPTDEQLAYAYTDTEILFPIYDAQAAAAEQNGQLDLLTTFSKLSYPTAVWELCGLTINAQRWREIADEVIQKRDETAAELEQLLLPAGYAEVFGGEVLESEVEDGEEDLRPNALIRISQRGLVLERLKDILGADFFFQVFADGKPSLDKDNRELMESAWLKLYGEPHPFFGLYKRWSKLAKQASTYGYSFLKHLHPITGRVHSTLVIAGTDTGRYSSNSPNTLNIPTPKGDDDVDFREAFVAPEGYVWANADYSAMEQRVAADGSGDENLIALFEKGGDNHSVTAALMFHIRRADIAEPRETDELRFRKEPVYGVEVPQSWTPREVIAYIVDSGLMARVAKEYKKTTRNTAKAVAFLFFFGGSPIGLAKKQNIPVAEAEQFFADFGGAYPQMVEWFGQRGEMPFQTATLAEDGETYGYADAYGGLRRWFRLPKNPSRRDYSPGWVGEAKFKEAQREFKKQRGAITREAKNVFTQGGNAVVMAEAVLRMVELGRSLAPDEVEGLSLEAQLKLGMFPFLAIYDEMLVLTPAGVEEKVANKLLVQAMQEPSEKHIRAVPSVVDANPLSGCWTKY
jgi:hypothetical protein